jgi:hypothetical protein
MAMHSLDLDHRIKRAEDRAHQCACEAQGYRDRISGAKVIAPFKGDSGHIDHLVRCAEMAERDAAVYASTARVLRGAAAMIVEKPKAVAPVVDGRSRVFDCPEYGCVVWIEKSWGKQVPVICEANDYYCNQARGVCDLTAPESQAFLDLINDFFGTNFRYEDFSGR